MHKYLLATRSQIDLSTFLQWCDKNWLLLGSSQGFWCALIFTFEKKLSLDNPVVVDVSDIFQPLLKFQRVSLIFPVPTVCSKSGQNPDLSNAKANLMFAVYSLIFCAYSLIFFALA